MNSNKSHSHLIGGKDLEGRHNLFSSVGFCGLACHEVDEGLEGDYAAVVRVHQSHDAGKLHLTLTENRHRNCQLQMYYLPNSYIYIAIVYICILPVYFYVLTRKKLYIYTIWRVLVIFVMGCGISNGRGLMITHQIVTHRDKTRAKIVWVHLAISLLHIEITL